MEGSNIIVKMKFGSHLYGTDGPDSDLDFKGVFLPEVGDLLLGPTFKGRYKKTISNNTNATDGKNTSSDVDEEFYSLHYFLKLALEGQTVALDMLHAPQSAIIEGSPLWDVLVDNRDRFYTKNLKAFVGYARKQAAKYGIKGSRLNDAEEVVNFLQVRLRKSVESPTLRDVWSELPKGEHIKIIRESRSEKAGSNALRMYQVCGKSFQETARLNYILPIIRGYLDNYGKRARLAAKNEGVDWKAMSHALRAAYQVTELLRDGTMTLPRPEAAFLRAVKEGEMSFVIVQGALEGAMAALEGLAESSDLPDKPDYKFAERFVHYAYGYGGTDGLLGI
jgi:hypothetical protein